MKSVEGKTEKAKEKNAAKQMKELWESAATVTRNKFEKMAKESLSQNSEPMVGKKRARTASPNV